MDCADVVQTSMDVVADCADGVQTSMAVVADCADVVQTSMAGVADCADGVRASMTVIETSSSSPSSSSSSSASSNNHNDNSKDALVGANYIDDTKLYYKDKAMISIIQSTLNKSTEDEAALVLVMAKRIWDELSTTATEPIPISFEDAVKEALAAVAAEESSSSSSSLQVSSQNLSSDVATDDVSQQVEGGNTNINIDMIPDEEFNEAIDELASLLDDEEAPVG